MFGNISPGLELLVTEGTLVGPLLLRPVTQEVFLDGPGGGQHLPATLGTGDGRPPVVGSANVNAEGDLLVKLHATDLTLVHRTFFLDDSLGGWSLQTRHGPGYVMVLPDP